MMDHIKMKTMERFQIEKLSYDLKLDILENMDPRDVVELVNVNKGFRSIVVWEPWRIFGKHVDCIRIDADNEQDPHQIFIEKFESCIFMDGDKRKMESPEWTYNLMELKGYSTLFSMIRSCQKLTFWVVDQGQGEAELAVKLLANLDSVSKLEIIIHEASGMKDIEKYLASLNLNHINSAKFEFFFLETNQQILGVWSNFIEKNLKHCKSIEILDKHPHFSFWYEPLSKIWTEMILLRFGYTSLDDEVDYRSLVQRIVTTGIPSLNPDATILFWVTRVSKRVEDSISGLLSRTPRIRQIVHKERGEVEEILKKLLLNELIPEGHRSFGESLLQESVFFIQPFESDRKCIYMIDPHEHQFFAKCITMG